ncbi:hypothetical protein ACHAXN_009945 [Cyclotella atomus]
MTIFEMHTKSCHGCFILIKDLRVKRGRMLRRYLLS